jgi:hypothetical protein
LVPVELQGLLVLEELQVELMVDIAHSIRRYLLVGVGVLVVVQVIVEVLEVEEQELPV